MGWEYVVRVPSGQAGNGDTVLSVSHQTSVWHHDEWGWWQLGAVDTEMHETMLQTRRMHVSHLILMPIKLRFNNFTSSQHKSAWKHKELQRRPDELTGLDACWEQITSALTNKHHSRHCKTTEEYSYQ